MLDVKGKRILLREPARDGRVERRDQFGPDVKESDAGRTQKIFECAADIKIDIERLDVERAGSAILLTVEHDQRAALVGALNDRRDL